ncbi:MAG: OmpA family protein, partial [Bacteroidota bacterium]
MKHFFLFLLLFPLPHFLSAQIQWDINFAFDQSSLSEIEEQKLDSLIQAHPNIKGIKLTGHTDERGDLDYNIELSRKRMESVRAFLLRIGMEDSLIEVAYFGESMPKANNADEAGRQKNRRVELLISLQVAEEMIEAEVITPPDPILIAKAEVIEVPQGDTLLEVEGAQVVMSKKDFQKYKECLEINFIVDGREALENEMSTMSSTGTPLISCGMMEIKLNGACAGGCFEPALKIRLPYPKGDCPRCEQGNFYNFLSNGSWRLNPNKEVEIVSIEGEKFYELRLGCPM